MRPYANIDYESAACIHKDSARLFGSAIKRIMDATGWDLPLVMKRISEEFRGYPELHPSDAGRRP